MKRIFLFLIVISSFEAQVQATSIFFKNNSSYTVDIEVRNWWWNGYYNTGILTQGAVYKSFPNNFIWAVDSAARRIITLAPGQKGDVYTTEGIVSLRYFPHDKVKIIGKQQEFYTSALDNINVPKAAIWELEIQDK